MKKLKNITGNILTMITLVVVVPLYSASALSANIARFIVSFNTAFCKTIGLTGIDRMYCPVRLMFRLCRFLRKSIK